MSVEAIIIGLTSVQAHASFASLSLSLSLSLATRRPLLEILNECAPQTPRPSSVAAVTLTAATSFCPLWLCVLVNVRAGKKKQFDVGTLDRRHTSIQRALDGKASRVIQ